MPCFCRVSGVLAVRSFCLDFVNLSLFSFSFFFPILGKFSVLELFSPFLLIRTFSTFLTIGRRPFSSTSSFAEGVWYPLCIWHVVALLLAHQGRLESSTPP